MAPDDLTINDARRAQAWCNGGPREWPVPSPQLPVPSPQLMIDHQPRFVTSSLTEHREAHTSPAATPPRPDPGDLRGRRFAMPAGVDSSLEDWEFHPATGMVAVQIGTCDMVEAAFQLIAAARGFAVSPHEAALLVIERQLRVG